MHRSLLSVEIIVLELEHNLLAAENIHPNPPALSIVTESGHRGHM
jgi:hypothetical protein